MSKQPSLLAYFGHHKCASQWIQGMLEDICLLNNLRCVQVSMVEELRGQNLLSYLAVQKADFLMFSNANIQEVRTLGELRGFHVVRDPRDLIVSAYFSHLYSHPINRWPGLSEHRQQLQSVSKQEGLLLEMDYSQRVLSEIGNWDYTQPNVMEVRMEQLVASPYEKMVDILTFLGMTKAPEARIGYTEQLLTLGTAALGHFQRVSLVAARAQFAAFKSLKNSSVPNAPQSPTHPDDDAATQAQHGRNRNVLNQFRISRRRVDLANLLLIIYRHRFASKAKGRDHGQEDSKSHYRKGTPSDWMNHFEPVHVDYFKRNYNDVLLKLGYETTPDW